MEPSSQEELVPISLFGGAMSIRMPEKLLDVSDFRPVPDHQEVWADGDHQSLIVEVVEHDPAVPDSASARYFWADLAQLNAAAELTREPEVQELAHLPMLAPLRSEKQHSVYACIACGLQHLSKGQQGPGNKVAVQLAVIRLPHVGSDLLLTFNTELFPTRPDRGAALAEAHELFKGMLQTLSVDDWGLFG